MGFYREELGQVEDSSSVHTLHAGGVFCAGFAAETFHPGATKLFNYPSLAKRSVDCC